MKVSRTALYEHHIINREEKKELKKYPIKFVIKEKKGELIARCVLNKKKYGLPKDSALKVVRNDREGRLALTANKKMIKAYNKTSVKNQMKIDEVRGMIFPMLRRMLADAALVAQLRR